MDTAERVVVIGLGYVGLPLAVALARTTEVWGLDVDAQRIAELRDGHDRTGEIDAERLAASPLTLTSDPADCPPADIYIVTVPTPVDADNQPDLSIVRAATRTVAGMIDPERTPIIVYESTVYPGVTEDICGPEIAAITGLTCGRDFFLGYSPERINPGDREHTVDRIMKVVAGQTPDVLDRVAALYERVTTGGVFRAASIKAAEAAKVIENAQRDINIAFMNEITRIFSRIDLSVWDVLAAARTKWNFLPFQPGLVGGHCIGVDPFYLSHLSETLGYHPQVILAGRGTNDTMAAWAADAIHARAGKAGRTLILGLTFKENVPDLRNSKVADLIARFTALGHDVTVHDPLADADEAGHEYGVTLDAGALSRDYDLVVLAVAHQDYLAMGADALAGLVVPGGVFADLKNGVPALRGRDGIGYWSL
ncbi:nucleotide sugar dehydrogenase [Sphingomonas donggukensis]|uniref:Nucleotide sugar dehydrogenase n=1 Tax=Sphingomonas donggukensis TaxID=2949093 RepID=A0ABY4TPZ3_9SPHN|nr:nucleotide sugar dehydrogenase [Sphingomonas donggukensis]URW74460.1 nucleotide sugar dehydrogenase [Sphingomonas donggukensis]